MICPSDRAGTTSSGRRTPPRPGTGPTTRARSSRRWCTGRARGPHAAGRCCTCTASPTTSSRPPAADYWVRPRLRLLRARPAQVRPLAAPHQTPNFVTDLDGLLRGARRGLPPGHRARRPRPRRGQRALHRWADRRRCGLHDRQPAVAGDGAELPLARPAGQPAAAHRRHQGDRPDRRPPALPRDPPRRVRLLRRSLHRDHDGEWDFDLAWKPLESWPVYAGWLRAVRRGHARAHRGLDVPAPGAGAHAPPAAATPRSTTRRARSTDIVLDVELIRKWAHKLADHVTLVRVEGALHDVTMSRRAGPRPRLRRDHPLARRLRRLSRPRRRGRRRAPCRTPRLG